MQKFQKLSRDEMRNVVGGLNNGCPGCSVSLGCSMENVGQFCPASFDGGICAACNCDGSPYYSCVPQD